MFARIKETDHFYALLEPIGGMIDIFKQIRSTYGDDVQILSAVPRPERNVVTAEEDKRNWISRYLGDDVTANIVLRKEKVLYAKEGRILIDDTGTNIREWREAGGTPILFTGIDDLRKELTRLGVI